MSALRKFRLNIKKSNIGCSLFVHTQKVLNFKKNYKLFTVFISQIVIFLIVISIITSINISTILFKMTR